MTRYAWSLRLTLVLAGTACSGEESSGSLSGANLDAASSQSAADASGAHDSGSGFDNPHQPILDASDSDADAAMVDASWHGEVPEVCDGTKRIPLRYFVGVGAGRPAPGEAVIAQNGYVYWFITGECHFYALDAPNRWYEVFHGELTPEAAQEIGRRVHYGDPLDGPWDGPPPQVSHGGTVVLELGAVTTGCYANCDNGPPEVRDAMEQAEAIWSELAASGELWNGPIRISSVERYGGIDPFFNTDWPLNIPPGVASVTEEVWNQGMYKGVLIEDQADLDALRALKTNTNAVRSMNLYGYVHIQATDTTYYEFRFRDAIPLENADGVIERTW